MKKITPNFLQKILYSTKKNQDRRVPRDYTALVESFKSKVQVN